MKNSKPVYVTKSFLPPRSEYDTYVDRIWESGHLTNRGPLLKEFEQQVSHYLGLDNFQFVTNGTLALQLAINGLGITEGEVITTPFSYVATTSAILWQRCTPVYVDIDKDTLNIDHTKIEEAITPRTKAILATHVFGNACDTEEIQRIADKHRLKVIYDGAHAFGAKYKGKSLLSYGDVSIVSFHATKLFHTVEGGGVISKDQSVHSQIDLEKRFGHNQDDHITLGINAKANEFQAAMGLANLKYIEDNIRKRRAISDSYTALLKEINVKNQLLRQSKFEYNYIYYPVIFDSNDDVERVLKKLELIKVFPRRYFYPSLNKLSYMKTYQAMPVSEDIATRILCLPLFSDMDQDLPRKIVDVIRGAV